MTRTRKESVKKMGFKLFPDAPSLPKSIFAPSFSLLCSSEEISAPKSSLWDDEEEEDIFSNPPVPTSVPAPAPATALPPSLLDDDDENNVPEVPEEVPRAELTKKKVAGLGFKLFPDSPLSPAAVPAKTQSLLADDEDEDIFNEPTFVPKPAAASSLSIASKEAVTASAPSSSPSTTSLWADEDSEEDIFSSKTPTSSSARQVNSAKASPVASAFSSSTSSTVSEAPSHAKSSKVKVPFLFLELTSLTS